MQYTMVKANVGQQRFLQKFYEALELFRLQEDIMVPKIGDNFLMCIFDLGTYRGGAY